MEERVLNVIPYNEVSQLISIADGELKRVREINGWYTFRIPIRIEHYYSLEEQLNAITKLGDSRNHRVLPYLQNLLKFAKVTWYNQNLENNNDDSGYIQYLHVKGELAKTLNHHWANSESECICDEEPDSHSLKIINNAIKTLEDSLMVG